MNSKLFIPEKCKVGFNPRTDTYSGKLAYVIAYDGKKWRKEPSWLGWIYQYNSSDEFLQRKKEFFLKEKERLTDVYEGYYSKKMKLL